MARIEGIDAKNASLFHRLVFWIVKRKIGKLTGDPRMIEPVRVISHHVGVLMGYARMENAMERAKTVPDRYKHLAMLIAAKRVECPF